MKGTEQHFPVVLFIMLYKVVLTFESVDEILKCDHSNEAMKQYFPVVLFIKLHKVVLTDKNTKMNRSHTIVRECFHFVSFCRIRTRLIQENRFLQQQASWSAFSFRKEINTNINTINNTAHVPNIDIQILAVCRMFFP